LQNQQLHQQLQETQQQLQETQLLSQQVEESRQLQQSLQANLKQITILNEEQAEKNRQLQTSQERQKQRLQQIEAELRFRDLELQFATIERDQYKGRLVAIESSKFWQLRTQWLAIKNQLGGKESPFWSPEIPFPEPVRPPSLPEQVELVEPSKSSVVFKLENLTLTSILLLGNPSLVVSSPSKFRFPITVLPTA
jgi:hypothetical protein